MLIFILLLLVSRNIFNLSKEFIAVTQARESSPYIFYGHQFAGLDDIFRDVEYVGYYTDKDLDVRKNAAQYAQAQYVLAPVVLDKDYEKYEFVLLDCSSEEKAWEKIRELKLMPIKKNRAGIILARKKR
ncbi:MAG: hypothetical protein WC552_00780 [Candidatus Omnitrophota bacterium]